MGLENREYLRDENARWSGGGGSLGGGMGFGAQSPMCRNLLIVTIVVYLLQVLSVRDWTQSELQAERDRIVAESRESLRGISDPEGRFEAQINALETAEGLTPGSVGLPRKVSMVQEWLELESSKVFSGQIWRVITCAFCHDRNNPMHILFNMLFLWWLGTRLESMYGSKEFLVFYLTAAMVASVAYIFIDLLSGDPRPMIGASGAVMAILMLYALHFPTQTVYIMFILPIEIRWIVLLYALFDLFPLLQQLSGEGGVSDNVAHAAHLGGLAFGYVYGKQQWRLYPWVMGMDTWWKARRRGFKLVGASGDDDAPTARSTRLAEEMDAILAKISEHGEASLTNAERRTLERASRELRNRRR